MPAHTDPAPAQEPASPSQAGVWEDLVDIFYAPGDVFARRRSDGRFWIAFGVFLLLALGLFLAMYRALAPMFDAEFARAMERVREENPAITAEQIEGMRGYQERFAPVGFLVGMAGSILLTGVAIWLVGLLLGAAQGIRHGFMISTYSHYPILLGMLLSIVQGLLLAPAMSRWAYSLGPARFADPDAVSPVLLTVLGGLDLFTIWSTVLIGIGFHVVGRVPTMQAALGAMAIWVLRLVPAMWGAAG